jgi:phosphate/sulfate permease
MIAIILILLATFFLAYANGANDNFKGVATLFGSGNPIKNIKDLYKSIEDKR